MAQRRVQGERSEEEEKKHLADKEAKEDMCFIFAIMLIIVAFVASIMVCTPLIWRGGC